MQGRSTISNQNMCKPMVMEAEQCRKKACALETIETFFLTPPSSEEYLLPNKCISRVNQSQNLEKPTFKLNDDEVELFDMSTKIDILNECYQKSLVGTVCCKILNRLTEKELLRASHVNKTWRNIIRYEDMKSGRRLSRYIRKMKSTHIREKENKGSPKLLSNKDRKENISTPLLDTSNICKERLEKEELFITPQCTPVSSNDSYKHCPQCQSPAKTSKLCGFCSKCNDKFCTYCFYTNDKHSPTCRVVGGSGVTCSPRKLSTATRRYSIGSKENKSRLKRI